MRIAALCVVTSLMSMLLGAYILYRVIELNRKIKSLSIQYSNTLQDTDVESIVRLFLENPGNKDYLTARAQNWVSKPVLNGEATTESNMPQMTDALQDIETEASLDLSDETQDAEI